MVILLPSGESFKKGFCQLLAKVCARSTGKVWLGTMTIAVDLGRKATKQTNKNLILCIHNEVNA